MSWRTFVEFIFRFSRNAVQLPVGTTRNYDGPKVAMSGDRLVKRPESHADKAACPLPRFQGPVRTASRQILRWIVTFDICGDCQYGIHEYDTRRPDYNNILRDGLDREPTSGLASSLHWKHGLTAGLESMLQKP